MSDFIYPNDQTVTFLECEDAFNALTDKEKLYAHFLSKACLCGGLTVLVQTSLESPLIFMLLHKLFCEQTINELKQVAINDCKFSEDEFQALLVYTSGIFSNMGNFKGFGDTKFIPNLPKEKFVKLVKESKASKQNSQSLENLLQKCIEPMYSLKEGEKQLGFPHIGITTYLSKNFNEEDQAVVKNFFRKQNIEAYNSRLFKTIDDSGQSCYEIRLASVLGTDDEEEKNLVASHFINGHKFVVTRGDYSKLLKLVNQHLSAAKDHAANDNETKMIENYIHSFQTGSLDAHKNGSRYWIKNKGPVIENYIGFIETYRDPAGMRGEFEGFVAMVNKPMSAKFSELVNSAEDFIPLLPWTKLYHTDNFLRPDFTSLDVLTFAGSGVPSGICIPNYGEIKQNEGFKNVTLGNVINGQTNEPRNFIDKADQELLDKYWVKAFEVHVGLHELLGHGSGKLFMKKKDETYNFDLNDVTKSGDMTKNWYEDGETFDSVFSSLSSPYEECRAECVGLFLSNVSEVLRIFGHEGAEADDVIYVNWLDMCQKGLDALKMYEPKTESWLQAHSRGRYVILQVLLEGGENFVNIEKIKGADGNPDLLIKVDRSKILTVGKPVIGEFLKKLQIYKSTANIKAAKLMFDKYSAVTSEDKYPFLDYREIVMARKRPRKMCVQANTFFKDGKVHLQNYEANHEGMIQSWIDRFQDVNVYDILEELWAKDKTHFA